MFVANVTEQFFEFRYALAEDAQKRIRAITIPPGAQVVLPDQNLTKGQVDYIVEQYGKYGFVKADEIGSKTWRGVFSGYAYDIDKPVPGARMELQYKLNFDVMQERGAKIRQETAIASNVRLNETLKEQTRNTDLNDKIDIRKFKTELEEVETKDTGKDAVVEHTFVNPDPSGSKIIPTRQRNARRSATPAGNVPN
jgi:hypothetical protein